MTLNEQLSYYYLCHTGLGALGIGGGGGGGGGVCVCVCEAYIHKFFSRMDS